MHIFGDRSGHMADRSIVNGSQFAAAPVTYVILGLPGRSGEIMLADVIVNNNEQF
jgi:hypothetical protein